MTWDDLTESTVKSTVNPAGVSPVGALVQTRYILEQEVSEAARIESIRLLTDQQLIRELARRIDGNPAAWEGTFGDVIESADEPESVDESEDARFLRSANTAFLDDQVHDADDGTG